MSIRWWCLTLVCLFLECLGVGSGYMCRLVVAGLGEVPLIGSIRGSGVATMTVLPLVLQQLW